MFLRSTCHSTAGNRALSAETGFPSGNSWGNLAFWESFGNSCGKFGNRALFVETVLEISLLSVLQCAYGSVVVCLWLCCSVCCNCRSPTCKGCFQNRSPSLLQCAYDFVAMCLWLCCSVPMAMSHSVLQQSLCPGIVATYCAP